MPRFVTLSIWVVPGQSYIASRKILNWIKKKDRTGGILGGKDLGTGLFFTG
jgi:hypothetical protein